MSVLQDKQRMAQLQRHGGAQPDNSQGLPYADYQHLVRNGFEISDGNSIDEAPPAYGEFHDHMQFNQPGYSAGAAVTDDGRVNINISSSTNRLADLLAPTFNRQIAAQHEPDLPPAYIPPSLGGRPDQVPPPRLNVVIQIVGSRGDVQPFVALGKVLKDTYGHRVRVATHATFQQFVEENGLEFFCIGGDPAELMAFMVKHPGLMPGFDALTSGEVTKRRKGIADMLLGCWRSCIEAGNGLGPPPKPHGRDEPLDLHAGLPGDENEEPFVADAIIANPPSFAHVHVAEKLGIPLHMMFTMPWSPTRAFPHPLANVQSSNVDDVMTNYMTYTLVEMMTWQGLGDVINRFRDRVLDLPPLALLWAPGLVNRLKISYTYCWSPALIPKPKDWGNNIDISGFFFLDLASSYTPPPDLAAFLDAGEPPVYIGFGSIVVDDPNAMTRMIFDAIRASGVRALVSKGWGGLGADELGVPEGVFMLGNVPHDWLFQRVSCVVHHGGAGTTAAGIKAGKPTVVVPFFGDQPFWGAMIAKAKAGPDPVPYKSLTAEKLAESITFCLQQDTSARARDLGQRIREEKGTDVGGQSFHNHLNTDNLRCTLAPSKTAAWRVRRTQVKLSPLAAAVLVEDGLLKYSDMKLYRSTEYNTEHQPPDPISAAASSIIMDATSIGMSIADMPKDLFRSRQRARENRNAQTPSAEDSDSPPPTLQGGLSPMASTTDVASVSSDHKGSGNSAMISPPSESARPGTASSSQLTSPDAASLRSPKSSRSRGPSVSRTPTSQQDATAAGIGLEAAVGTGRNVGRIVSTGVKSPMNFCLGVAKGFRNIPLAYNDDTVRPVEKVTDLSSGIRVAGKEFGLGLYDGISGLVTQPLRGAAKDGAPGLVKGFGKGIGGLIVKPAAAVWSLPAYTMQGVHAEVSKMFAKSSQNYIIASRIAQGRNEILNATREEQQDIILRWRSLGSDLKDFNNLKKKEKTAGKSPASSSAMLSPEPGASRMEVPSWLRGQLSLDERRKIRAQKEAAKKAGVQHYPDVNTSSSTLSSEDAEFERAILASVRDTSRGNAEEDAMIEAAIRESVAAVRQSGGLPEPVRTDKSSQAWPEKSPAMFQDEEYQITDEEYQALVEQAIKQSMGVLPASDMDEFHETKGKYPDTVVRESSAGPSGNVRDEDDEDLQRALAASRIAPALPPRQVDNPTDDDELQRAIEASKQDLELEQAQKTEEDVVFEYMRKQSLAEEEWRRLAAKGKGPADEDDDEEFKRALEESLKMGHGNGQHGSGGPSSRA